MPYIPQNRRPFLMPDPEQRAENEGELNFQISCLLNNYMLLHGTSYDKMGDCVAACENAAHEFQRRVIDDHEDHKRFINGDVYSPAVINRRSDI